MDYIPNQASSAFDQMPRPYPPPPPVSTPIGSEPRDLKNKQYESLRHHLQASAAVQPSSAPSSAYPTYPLPYQNDLGTLHSSSSPVSASFAPANQGSLDLPSRAAHYGVDQPVRTTAASIGPLRISEASRPSFLPNHRPDSVDGSGEDSPQSARGLGGSSLVSERPLKAEGTPDDGTDAHTATASGDNRASSSRDEKDDQILLVSPWSDLKTKAGKERKRLPLACIACRRKKIRCSGEKPACKHCLRSRIPCVYRVTARKAAPRTDYMAMLDKRLKRMEDRIIRIIPKHESGHGPSFGRAIVKPLVPGSAAAAAAAAAARAAHSRKRAAGDAFGTDLDNWANEKPPQNGDPEARPTPLGHAGPDSELSMLTEGAASLPSAEIQEHLVEVFFDCVYGQSYHLLHKPSFMMKLRDKSVPPVLMLAICAVSARFSTHPRVNAEPAFLRGESWAAEARVIARRRYDEPNLTIVIVMLLLGLHEFGTCHGGRSWSFCGMAIRMSYALQLHKDLDHDPSNGGAKLSFTDREIRRRTMWACFLMDRFNSSGTDRPTFVDEDTIKVQLPIKESLFLMQIPGLTENLDGSISATENDAKGGPLSDAKENMGVAAYMIRCVQIWGQVIKYLNLGGRDKDKHPIWSAKSAFATLHKQAQDFQNSFPDSLQYTPENLHAHATEKVANQFLFLHIATWQVVLSMNRHAVPSASTGSLVQDAPPEYHARTMHKAVESADQISMLIRDCADHFVVAPFIGYCAFVSSLIHIWGLFSKNPRLEASCKVNLTHNVKYIGKMKKYWGMFHFMAQNLKDTYKRYADAAQGETSDDPQGAKIFQYGDWFNRYPRGVSRTHYQDPVRDEEGAASNDTVLTHKSDLQSAEEFFAGLSPASRPPTRTKPAKRQATKRAGLQATRIKTESRSHSPPGPTPNSASGPPPIDHPMTGPILADPVAPLPPPQHQQQALDPTYAQAMTMAQMDPSSMYSGPPPQAHQPAFPMDSYPPDADMLGPQQHGFVPHLDRHLVFGPYAAGGDPVTATLGLNNVSWNLNMSGLGPGGVGEASNALFIPFNLHTPQLDGDGMEGCGPPFQSPSVGVNGYVPRMADPHANPGGMGGPGM